MTLAMAQPVTASVPTGAPVPYAPERAEFTIPVAGYGGGEHLEAAAAAVAVPEAADASNAARFLSATDEISWVIDVTAFGGGDEGTVSYWVVDNATSQPRHLADLEWEAALTETPIADLVVYDAAGAPAWEETFPAPQLSLRAGPVDDICETGCNQMGTAVGLGFTGVGAVCVVGGFLTVGIAWVACGVAAGFGGLLAGGVTAVMCDDEGAACQSAVLSREHPHVEVECDSSACDMRGTIVREDRQQNYVSRIESSWHYEGINSLHKTLGTSQHNTNYQFVNSNGTWYYIATIHGRITKAGGCSYTILNVQLNLRYYNGTEGVGSNTAPYC